jgi:hypothetical protein
VREITPPAGTPLSGYPRIRNDLPWTPSAIKGYVGRLGPSTGAHDPLLATALALEHGGRTLVIVGLDTLIVTRAFTAGLRDALAARGVDRGCVLVGASHTHGGPDLFSWWDEAPADLERSTLARVCDAAHEALDRLEPAALGLGLGRLDDVAVNRRDEAAGPLDPDVLALRVDSLARGTPLGLLVRFTCHPVTLDYGNVLATADYVHELRRTVAASYRGATTVFLNGSAGNVNPARFPYEQRANVYVPQTEENYPVYWGGFRDAERLGRIVGAEAVQAAERALPLEPGPCDGLTRELELPLKEREALEQYLEFMAFRAPYADALRAAPSLRSEVQALAIGELRLAALPGEPFVELGLQVAREAGGPDRRVAAVGYANDDVRYVMTPDAYDGGQYETVGTPLAQGSAEAMTAAALDALAELERRAS